MQATVENCGIKCADNKIMLTVELCWGRKTDTLTTKSASSFDGRSATFDEADNFLQFAGPEELRCVTCRTWHTKNCTYRLLSTI